MIAVAVFHQVLQRIAQLPQLQNLLVQLLDMLARQGLHIGAWPLPVLPHVSSLTDFFQ